ncbi:MAG: Autophagy protein 29 [Lichina confinis]|nr:MAG: Autophagy protein 29 [Lichina confinis]
MSRFPLSSGEQTERPRFTVFVRLPFPRGEFQDPPPVSWDAGKERMLWKVLSQASGDGELDWDELCVFNASEARQCAK